MKKTSVSECHKRFKEGRENMEDDEDNSHHFLLGSVHFGFIPQGQTVNQASYVEILKLLCEAVRTEGPELWSND